MICHLASQFTRALEKEINILQASLPIWQCLVNVVYTQCSCIKAFDSKVLLNKTCDQPIVDGHDFFGRFLNLGLQFPFQNVGRVQKDCIFDQDSMS